MRKEEKQYQFCYILILGIKGLSLALASNIKGTEHATGAECCQAP